ncbi:MAG: glycoside hydrolase family 3 domain protein [Caulobacter sp.]|nr:glycoside hydrolase family 3 domain protein [Caulobacter sp.]
MAASDEEHGGFDRRRVMAGLSSAALLAQAGAAMARTRPAPPMMQPSPRIETLIAAMTVEEKAGQLSLVPDVRGGAVFGVNPVLIQRQLEPIRDRIRAGQVSGTFNGMGVEEGRKLQDIAVKESRMGIPLIFAGDIIHGLHTIFPVPLAESAAFDPALSERTARAAAQEATACGFHWTFAPMVDVARDQRWGRVVEGSGEDVYLGSMLAAARVRGFQGRRLSDPDSLLACAKHFAAYGAVGGGMDYNGVDISEASLRDIHLPPFKAAFDAGALSVMSAFNDINGIPSTANPHLMKDILRGEWDFRGFVISDYTADQELVAHGYAADDRQAAKLAFLAGVDMSMASDLYNLYLPALVAAGEVPMATLDASVRRVLMVKQLLGLFDDPYRCLDVNRERTQVHTPAAHALAREAGRRSIVLLKNQGNVLPLPKTGKRLALIGPFGADGGNLHGPWSMFGDGGPISLEKGLREAMGAGAQLSVVKGCEVESAIAGGIEAAVAAARDADVVLLAIGEDQTMSGEAQSRTAVIVPPAQQRLAEAVAAVAAAGGKPVVIVLKNGRALALSGAVRDAPALLVTWFLGSESGRAIADVLFGDVSPSGRLPVSFPFESGQEPYVYSHRSTGRPQLDGGTAEFKARYRETPTGALYPFGAGLTYSSFRYDAAAFSADVMAWNGSLVVKTRLTNTGPRRAEELVQLYIHQRVASLAPPVRLLKGFRKVGLDPGQSTDVVFTLTRRDLEFVGADLKPVVEPGLFDVWVGPSAAEGIAKTFRLSAT